MFILAHDVGGRPHFPDAKAAEGEDGARGAARTHQEHPLPSSSPPFLQPLAESPLPLINPLHGDLALFQLCRAPGNDLEGSVTAGPNAGAAPPLPYGHRDLTSSQAVLCVNLVLRNSVKGFRSLANYLISR